MLAQLLRPRLSNCRRQIARIGLLQAVQAVASLYLPALNADLIDNGVVTGDTGTVVRTGVVMLVVATTQIVCAAAAGILSARTAMAIGRDIRADVFAHVQSLSARTLGRFGVPSLVTRTTNDVQQIQSLMLFVLVLIVPVPIICGGSVLLASRQAGLLAAVVMAVVPVLVVAVVLVGRRMWPVYAGVQDAVDSIGRLLREQITGLRVIRAFNRDRHEQARFARANGTLMGVSMRVGRLVAVMSPMSLLIVNVAGVAVIWFGGHQVADGDMQVGALVAFLGYLTQVLGAVLLASFLIVAVPRAAISAGRIRDVLGTEADVVEPPSPMHLVRPSGHLVVRQVGYRYPGAEAPVLRDIDLCVRPGETVALVGSGGSGKSTLLGLIARLADVTDGAVLVDGVDIRQLAPKTLHRLVGLVTQRPQLFSGTVASNLRLGDPDATDADLWRALAVAQAEDFVAALPDGLDAPVSQGGANLSGGQRQRLAIARTVLRKPLIYLFDDVFSALDQGTEARLRAALTEETAHASVVMVSQRATAPRGADRIVVLDEGKVVGAGDHLELVDTNPVYREIVRYQVAAERAR
ncbi:multidrug ABC transporter ATP-binding protein [Actinosynnema sp. ALI-1.44]|uniref:ABC transporter ATP-binding protein n=1 Tax=Actinosynnema sp. ALI-1.44 TaxID=1933779 RepID=UPI00097C91C5|nr:ABC transporter ATP-binding protein [Actinosynnema sp. ALI-1.44]ONI83189.1 multidrug ABC transporter ATP-binding protein [Actinosynnema sp. ALI-1.44]